MRKTLDCLVERCPACRLYFYSNVPLIVNEETGTLTDVQVKDLIPVMREYHQTHKHDVQ